VESKKDESEYCIYMKGAPENIWNYCINILIDHKNVKIGPEHKKHFEAVNHELASKGERVIGFAKLHLPIESYPLGFPFCKAKQNQFNVRLHNLTFLGLVSLVDPPKESIFESIQLCRLSGIQVIMITGDQIATATAVARSLNIIPQNVRTVHEVIQEKDCSWEEAFIQAQAIVIHGDQIVKSFEKQKDKGMTDEDLDLELRMWVKKPFCVFARTSPAQKQKIVIALQRIGHFVAVTGENINDSPALKQANIAIASGKDKQLITGQIADIILLNENFSTIVEAIEEGRTFFNNLKKILAYVLSLRLPFMIVMLLAVVLAIPLAFPNILILVLAITDIYPAVSFAYEKIEFEGMFEPSKKQKAITNSLILQSYFINGIVATGILFATYLATANLFGFQINQLAFITAKSAFTVIFSYFLELQAPFPVGSPCSQSDLTPFNVDWIFG